MLGEDSTPGAWSTACGVPSVLLCRRRQSGGIGPGRPTGVCNGVAVVTEDVVEIGMTAALMLDDHPCYLQLGFQSMWRSQH